MRPKFVIAYLVVGTLALVAAAGPLMSRVENLNYTVERAEGPIEVRSYPPMVVASVVTHGARTKAISNGFSILAGYIFGGNEASKKVAMTSLVMQERAADRDGWTIRFVMPKEWSLERLPKAKDSRIALSQMRAATYAVIRFSGVGRDAALKARTQELMDFVARSGLAAQGAPVFAFYNGRRGSVGSSDPTFRQLVDGRGDAERRDRIGICAFSQERFAATS